MVQFAPNTDPPPPTLDLESLQTESILTLAGIMRTADNDRLRLSAARTLATLTTRLITSRDRTQAQASRGSQSRSKPIHTDADAQERAAPSTKPAPAPAPARASSRKAASLEAALTRMPPYVIAQPPLTEKSYPAPNAVLDPLFDVLASPIPTTPMTEAELDELQAIHTGLKREDLKNPRRAARWRHQLREDRFWKAYWDEHAKNPRAFTQYLNWFMNRHTNEPGASPPPALTNTPAPTPSEPLASASGPAPLTSGP